jgi:hypothetical protein
MMVGLAVMSYRAFISSVLLFLWMEGNLKICLLHNSNVLLSNIISSLVFFLTVQGLVLIQHFILLR